MSALGVSVFTVVTGTIVLLCCVHVAKKGRRCDKLILIWMPTEGER